MTVQGGCGWKHGRVMLDCLLKIKAKLIALSVSLGCLFCRMYVQ